MIVNEGAFHGTAQGFDPDGLFFTAGLPGENGIVHGLFGEIQPVSVPGPIAGAGLPGLV
jgi:hypothetical protein